MEAQTKKKLNVELIQVEMPAMGDVSCSACNIVHRNLTSAIQDVQKLFNKLDCEIIFKKTNIRTVEEAEKNQIIASPTIRVGNLDFYPRHLGDSSEEREWAWNGLIMSSPDKESLIEVLLKGYFEPKKEKEKNELSSYILKHLNKNETPEPSCGCN